MATSLADLLTEITRYVEKRQPTAELAAETVAAIGELHRCIPGLTCTGLADISTRQTVLAVACASFCQGAGARPGRLRDLAGASADLIKILQDELTSGQRWAVFIEINDTLHDLIRTHRIGKGSHDIPGARRLFALERAIVDIDRAAAVRPPEPADVGILSRPVPPAARRSPAVTAAPAIVDAAAGLQHYTAPPHTLSLADFLAVTIAADTVCQCAGALARTDGRRLTVWREVQRELRPFNDGSRRGHAVTSPLVVHALYLHDACVQLLASGQTTRTHLTAVRSALNALVDVAANLHLELRRWGARHTLSGYAVDLDAGCRYPTQHVAGRRTAGIISAGRVELMPAMRAVDRAHATTLRLSLRLAEVVNIAATDDFGVRPAPALRAPNGSGPAAAGPAPRRHL